MIAGAVLLGAGLLASALLLLAELRRVRSDTLHLKRFAPELHVVAALLGGAGAWLLGGWAWGLGAGLAHAVAGVAAAAGIGRL